MPATILHVANFSDRPKGAAFSATQYKLTNGLIRSGHNVVTFSDRDAARASTPLLSKAAGRGGANRRLLALVESLAPDVVLLGHADVVQPEILAEMRLRRPGLRLAQWNVDPLFDIGNVARLRAKLEVVDWTFVTTAGPLLAELGAGGARVAFMPNPVDISIERGRAFDTAALPWDVFYAVGAPELARFHCGAPDTPRRIVARLRARLPGRRFLTPGIDHARLEGAGCVQALALAKVGLNISRRNDVTWYASDRMAHLAGNGVVVATERAAGFDALFAEDEMAFYDSEDELAAVLDRLLSDDGARQDMARRGWRAYHRMFDSTRVAQYLMAVLDGTVDPARFDWRDGASRPEPQRSVRYA